MGELTRPTSARVRQIPPLFSDLSHSFDVTPAKGCESLETTLASACGSIMTPWGTVNGGERLVIQETCKRKEDAQITLLREEVAQTTREMSRLQRDITKFLNEFKLEVRGSNRLNSDNIADVVKNEVEASIRRSLDLAPIAAAIHESRAPVDFSCVVGELRAMQSKIDMAFSATPVLNEMNILRSEIHGVSVTADAVQSKIDATPVLNEMNVIRSEIHSVSVGIDAMQTKMNMAPVLNEMNALLSEIHAVSSKVDAAQKDRVELFRAIQEKNSPDLSAVVAAIQEKKVDLSPVLTAIREKDIVVDLWPVLESIQKMRAEDSCSILRGIDQLQTKIDDARQHWKETSPLPLLSEIRGVLGEMKFESVLQAIHDNRAEVDFQPLISEIRVLVSNIGKLQAVYDEPVKVDFAPVTQEIGEHLKPIMKSILDLSGVVCSVPPLQIDLPTIVRAIEDTLGRIDLAPILREVRAMTFDANARIDLSPVLAAIAGVHNSNVELANIMREVARSHPSQRR